MSTRWHGVARAQLVLHAIHAACCEIAYEGQLQVLRSDGLRRFLSGWLAIWTQKRRLMHTKLICNCNVLGRESMCRPCMVRGCTSNRRVDSAMGAPALTPASEAAGRCTPGEAARRHAVNRKVPAGSACAPAPLLIAIRGMGSVQTTTPVCPPVSECRVDQAWHPAAALYAGLCDSETEASSAAAVVAAEQRAGLVISPVLVLTPQADHAR
jgi:hypothetical protein